MGPKEPHHVIQPEGVLTAEEATAIARGIQHRFTDNEALIEAFLVSNGIEEEHRPPQQELERLVTKVLAVQEDMVGKMDMGKVLRELQLYRDRTGYSGIRALALAKRYLELSAGPRST